MTNIQDIREDARVHDIVDTLERMRADYLEKKNSGQYAKDYLLKMKQDVEKTVKDQMEKMFTTFAAEVQQAEGEIKKDFTTNYFEADPQKQLLLRKDIELQMELRSHRDVLDLADDTIADLKTNKFFEEYDLDEMYDLLHNYRNYKEKRKSNFKSQRVLEEGEEKIKGFKEYWERRKLELDYLRRELKRREGQYKEPGIDNGDSMESRLTRIEAYISDKGVNEPWVYTKTYKQVHANKIMIPQLQRGVRSLGIITTLEPDGSNRMTHINLEHSEPGFKQAK